MAAFSTNILIVGAGPTGLTTALGLAQRGIEFRIIDALPEAQNTSRGDAGKPAWFGDRRAPDRPGYEGAALSRP